MLGKTDVGTALIEYLAARQRGHMISLAEVNPSESGMVGRMQGAIIELTALGTLLSADLNEVAETLEMEAS